MSATNDSRTPNGSPLETFPSEVWSMIANYLPPYDLLYLSHSCKTLRAVAERFLPGDFPDFSLFQKRFAFAEALANTSLDHWVCVGCAKIHQAGFWDIPSKAHVHYQYPCRCSDPFSNAGSYHDGKSMYLTSYHGSYWVHLRHVQLALKYTGSAQLSAYHSRHLEALMAPYFHQGDLTSSSLGSSPLYSTGPDNLNTYLDYRAVPKIFETEIEGNGPILRYIGYEEWRYTMTCDMHGTAIPAEWDSLRVEYYARRHALKSLHACSHRADPLSGDLCVHMRTLFDRPVGEVMNFSCTICPSDFEMGFEEMVAGSGRREVFVFRAWKDMRTSEREWKRRMIWRSGALKRLGPLHYEPGDARHLYENEGRLPRRTYAAVVESAPEVEAEAVAEAEAILDAFARAQVEVEGPYLWNSFGQCLRDIVIFVAIYFSFAMGFYTLTFMWRRW